MDKQNTLKVAAVITVAAITISTATAFAVQKKARAVTIMANATPPVLPEGTVVSSFVNSRSQRIHTIRLSPKSKKVATVFFLHGIGDHSGRPCYCRVFERLVSENIEVWAMDHHGHGQSEGERAYCEQFEDYVEDCLGYIQQNYKDNDDTPLILMGHSLGGLMSILLAKKLGSKVKGVVLTAPACGVEMDVEKKVQKFLSPLLNVLVPKVKVRGTHIL